jgi:hypothetical protein
MPEVVAAAGYFGPDNKHYRDDLTPYELILLLMSFSVQFDKWERSLGERDEVEVEVEKEPKRCSARGKDLRI